MLTRLLFILSFLFIHIKAFEQRHKKNTDEVDKVKPAFVYATDFNKIRDSTKNDTCDISYKKLLSRFLNTDKTLTDREALALMIGFTVNPNYKPLEDLKIETEIFDSVKAENYEKTIQICKKFLATHPLNMRALHAITISYNKLNNTDTADYYMWLHNKLMYAMIHSAKGYTIEDPIFSLEIRDGEYYIENIDYILNKKTVDKKKGQYFEIIDAYDLNAQYRKVYFAIQHAKNAVDDERAREIALAKKIKLDLKNRADLQKSALVIKKMPMDKKIPAFVKLIHDKKISKDSLRYDSSFVGIMNDTLYDYVLNPKKYDSIVLANKKAVMMARLEHRDSARKMLADARSNRARKEQMMRKAQKERRDSISSSNDSSLALNRNIQNKRVRPDRRSSVQDRRKLHQSNNNSAANDSTNQDITTIDSLQFTKSSNQTKEKVSSKSSKAKPEKRNPIQERRRLHQKNETITTEKDSTTQPDASVDSTQINKIEDQNNSTINQEKTTQKAKPQRNNSVRDRRRTQQNNESNVKENESTNQMITAVDTTQTNKIDNQNNSTVIPEKETQKAKTEKRNPVQERRRLNQNNERNVKENESTNQAVTSIDTTHINKIEDQNNSISAPEKENQKAKPERKNTVRDRRRSQQNDSKNKTDVEDSSKVISDLPASSDTNNITQPEIQQSAPSETSPVPTAPVSNDSTNNSSQINSTTPQNTNTETNNTSSPVNNTTQTPPANPQ